MPIADLLALAVIVVAVPLNWIVAVLLWRLHRASPQIPVLRERALLAVAVSLIVTVFALIFVNNDMTVPPLSLADTKLITRTALLLLSVLPALFWLWLYRRAK